MGIFLLALLLLAVAALALLLEKTYFAVPIHELKRRAAQGPGEASILYQAVAFDGELRLLLWLVTALTAAGGLVLLVRLAPSLLGFIVIAAVLSMTFWWLPSAAHNKLGRQLAVWLAAPLRSVLQFLHPVLAHPAKRVPAGSKSTHLYEQSDVIELLERQKKQADNRISDDQLELMRRALHFGHYTVKDVVVPRRQVKTVDANDSLGPVVLDELHASGHAYFPVLEGKHGDLLGMLALEDVANVKNGGTVRTYARPRLTYVHEDDSLTQTLQTLYSSRQHLLIVINGHNEFVGVLTLGDVLSKLFDVTKHPEPTRHEDRAAVAAQPQPTTRHGLTNEEATVYERPTEVVE